MNKTRYSPVAPIHILERLFDTDSGKGEPLIGSYLLLLAHDVLDNSKRYSRLISDVRHVFGDDTFVMMDNSVVELGRPMKTTLVIEAAQIVKADCIMSPDELRNYSGTRANVLADEVVLRTSGFPIMKIPQGPTIWSLEQCVSWLGLMLPPDDVSTQDFWGVPRWIANELRSRSAIVKFINTVREHPKIHLLGMSTNLEDDIMCLRMDNVMGIDSANPIVMGLAGLDIGKDRYEHLDRGDYWRAKTLTQQAQQNVEYMHIVCSH